MANLTGSEKQVAWAESIIATHNANARLTAAFLEENADWMDDAEMLLTGVQRIQEIINSVEDSGDIIDWRGSVYGLIRRALRVNSGNPDFDAAFEEFQSLERSARLIDGAADL